MSNALRIFPLFALPLALYAIFAFAGQASDWTDAEAFAVSMFSGAVWRVSVGDLFVLAGVGALFVETLKASNTTASEILNHGLSMLVAIACLVLFITMPAFANSAFFLLTVMAFFDVAAGLAITIVAARRDFGAAVH